MKCLTWCHPPCPEQGGCAVGRRLPAGAAHGARRRNSGWQVPGAALTACTTVTATVNLLLRISKAPGTGTVLLGAMAELGGARRSAWRRRSAGRRQAPASRTWTRATPSRGAGSCSCMQHCRRWSGLQARAEVKSGSGPSTTLEERMKQFLGWHRLESRVWSGSA